MLFQKMHLKLKLENEIILKLMRFILQSFKISILLVINNNNNIIRTH